MLFSPPDTLNSPGPGPVRPALARVLAASIVAASAVVLPLTHAGPQGGTQGLAEAEVQRRQALVNDANAQVQEGRMLYEAGKFEESLRAYSSALSSLPKAPLTQASRDAAALGFAAASVARARELGTEGRYQEANELLDAVLKEDVSPGYAPALELQEKLADPDRFPPALTPQHVANVKEVERLLVMANSQFELGDYDAANETYLSVLRIDGYNAAARRGMERLEQKKAEYYNSARDHQRARMLAEVDSLWNGQVPPSDTELGLYDAARSDSLRTAEGNRERIVRKLSEMVVPRVDFTGATLDEVIEFLRVRSRDLDPEGQGINFVLDVPVEISSRTLDLNLTGIPMEELVRYVAEKAGARFKIDSFAVKFVSLSSGANEMLVKQYKVPPGFIENSAATEAPAPSDPFAQNAPTTGALTLKRLTAKEFLEARGVSFPEGSMARYSPTTNTLAVRNTGANLEIIDMLVDQAATDSPKQAQISVKLIEITQNNLEELGFDWLLGSFSVPGSDRVFGSGGTPGSAEASTDLSTNFPNLYPGTDVPVGRFPMTASNRSSGEILGRPTLDSLLGENVELPPVNSRSPGQFAITGVMSDPQFQVVIRALNQNKGVDFMAMPSIVAKSGQKANIDLATEFIYPTEFDPPEVPEQVGGFNLGGVRFVGGSASAPVTPSTPTTFEMRKVGTVIELEPVISADGREVEIVVTPEVTEFEGFIDYASDINNTVDLGYTIVRQPVDNRIIQPIFRTNRLTTAVKVYDGSTVVLGGVITEERTKVEDKIPVIGDIPLVGRLWQSSVDQVLKRNFVVFITVNVIDPSGQRVNREGTLVGPQTTMNQ